ncbi:molybdopterin molybdotransferase MoeA [Streptomyces violens]|uniref:molybdopterin molybdotransferase MoeA n=1 Tax=Streptomyces violens TaxID=66377 RepID=UPI0009963021|nr:molybdopterin molybdotransferase MoeA [Streptomyces violens]
MMPGLTGDPGEFDDALAIANAGRPRTPDAAPRVPDAAPRTADAAPHGAEHRVRERSSERTWMDPWHAPWGNGRHEAGPEAAAAARTPEPEPHQEPKPGPGGPGAPDLPAAPEPQPSAPAHSPNSPAPAASRTAPAHRHSAHSPWHDARAAAAGAVAGPLEAATVPLGPEALGRVLAGALTALTDLPSFDTSAMDGWAVSGPGPWRVTAPSTLAPSATAGILAGQGPARPLPAGHAIRIATGARIPPGASAVLRSEHGETVEQADGGALLSAPGGAPPGQDIRPRGQECRNGDQLLPPGTSVTPAVLGLAAAAGYDELWTYRRPVVEILVLGDELLHSGLPQEGRIRDALGPMLAPWLHALGAETIGPRHLADDEGVLYEAIASSTADVVITTGGTAAGPVDHVHPTLRRLGAELLVDGVQVRPGHPMLLARLDPADGTTPRGRSAKRTKRPVRTPRTPRHLVGLPGNPLAAVSGLLTLAEPLLGTLSGRTRSEPRRVRLADGVHGHPHDTRLVPVACRTDEKGGVVALPLHFNGPAMLRGIAAADALAVIPPGGAAEGESAVLLGLPWSPAATTSDIGATGGRV